LSDTNLNGGSTFASSWTNPLSLCPWSLGWPSWFKPPWWVSWAILPFVWAQLLGSWLCIVLGLMPDFTKKVSTPFMPDYWANLYFKTNFNH
jgi:hypothetical protein